MGNLNMKETFGSQSVLGNGGSRSSIEDAELQLQLEKTVSLAPPPDGGIVAWLQVLACFILFFNTW